MSIEVELPALGESVVEGTLSKWLVREGQSVVVDQPLVEVTTDKVDAEIPSPCAGVIEQILVAEGETVPVGEKLVRIAVASQRGEADAAASPVPRKNPDNQVTAIHLPVGAGHLDGYRGYADLLRRPAYYSRQAIQDKVPGQRSGNHPPVQRRCHVLGLQLGVVFRSCKSGRKRY